jgi:hypothetical protein
MLDPGPNPVPEPVMFYGSGSCRSYGSGFGSIAQNRFRVFDSHAFNQFCGLYPDTGGKINLRFEVLTSNNINFFYLVNFLLY